jgi:hypothetical protein
MTVTLPKEKVDRIKDECLRLQKKNKTSIREVSKIIGILVSSFSAVDYGTLHNRILVEYTGFISLVYILGALVIPLVKQVY